MSVTAAPSTRRALTFALTLYLLWVLVTYLLESRILTLQRPEATGARLTYALVANNLIGIGGSVLVVRFLSNSGEISARQVWFRGPRHAQSSTPFGPATPQKESTQAKNHSPDTP
jgi:hypothetical protein